MPDYLPDDYLLYSPFPPSSTLEKWLKDSNQITRQILKNLQIGEEYVPKLDILNPPLWEFGHLTWFHEFWVHRDGQANKPSFMADADYLFNSSEIAHQDRWSTPIPCLDDLLEYNYSVIDRTSQLLRNPVDTKTAYFIQLAIFHQDMHNEAFAYMWQSLGYSWPLAGDLGSITPQQNNLEPLYIKIPQSQLQLGSARNTGFIFDNEKWQHEVLVPSFSISSHAVSNGEYLEFLRSLSEVGTSSVEHQPAYWKKAGDVWFERCFDQWLEIDLKAPVRHISAHNAEQYCLWRGVRLPTENELNTLMVSPNAHWIQSNLWEWTSSTFLPFEGFSSDPYQDYSAPWFDGRRWLLYLLGIN